VVAATLVVTCLLTLQLMGRSGAPAFHLLHNRQLITWAVWAALAPAIIAGARRFPFGEGDRLAWLGRHLVLGVLVSAASQLIAPALGSLFGVPVPAVWDGAAPAGVIATLSGDLLKYGLIAVSYQAIAYQGAVREREAVTARLRVELAEAKLANLEGKLHPHFLFNTLNAIAALVRRDPRAAETMVEQLSELLRASFQANPLREVPLEEELRLTEQYLAIEQARYQDRLRSTIEATSEARQAGVPQLILQPLVENAVRHGIAPRVAGGAVRVTASVDGGALVMTVEDDGVGLGNAPREQAGTGLGLSSVRSRLAQLYGTSQSFAVDRGASAGTRITITMPFRPAPA
jgi:signal transduction histidine kinase